MKLERRRRPRLPKRAPPVEKTSKTKHSIQINGKTLDYTATAGTLLLKKDDKPWASMFYVAYTRGRRAGRFETADHFRV